MEVSVGRVGRGGGEKEQPKENFTLEEKKEGDQAGHEGGGP